MSRPSGACRRAALMVLSTAAGPVVLGLLFDLGASLFAIGVATLAYVLAVPLVLTRFLGVRR